MRHRPLCDVAFNRADSHPHYPRLLFALADNGRAAAAAKELGVAGRRFVAGQ